MSKTSIDGTKYMLGLVTNALNNQKERLARLQTCTELEVSVPYGKGEYIRKRYTQQRHTVTLKASDQHTDRDGYVMHGTKFTTPDGKSHFMQFEQERKSQIYRTEKDIESIEGDIKFLNQKIAEFKPME